MRASSSQVPATLFQLPKLTSLSLGFNALTGTLPVAAAAGVSALVGLFLENNALGGTVPPALASLNGTLKQLELDHNAFSGTVTILLSSLFSKKNIWTNRSNETAERA